MLPSGDVTETWPATSAALESLELFVSQPAKSATATKVGMSLRFISASVGHKKTNRFASVLRAASEFRRFIPDHGFVFGIERVAAHGTSKRCSYGESAAKPCATNDAMIARQNNQSVEGFSHLAYFCFSRIGASKRMFDRFRVLNLAVLFHGGTNR